MPIFYLKLTVAALLLLFLPLLSFTYYFFRRQQRILEDKRRLKTLDILEHYRELSEYGERYGAHLVLAVLFLSTVVAIGLGVLFFPKQLGFDESSVGALEFPKGSALVVGMAFLGAYLWGLQYLIRRYFMNDLIPGLYYRIGLRMFLAAALALLISNAFKALSGATGGSGIDETVWPAVAFLIGMFPQRGLQWLTARFPLFTPRPDPSVRDLPLEMIEGISNYDKMRLEELGIDNCYDLADEDFVPLMLATPYSARKLISWILQAKLCVHAGDGVKALRERNIRRITDLKDLNDKHIEDLAAQTPLTKEGLKRAQKALLDDKEIGRLIDAALKLGHYTKSESVSDR